MIRRWLRTAYRSACDSIVVCGPMRCEKGIGNSMTLSGTVKWRRRGRDGVGGRVGWTGRPLLLLTLYPAIQEIG